MSLCLERRLNVLQKIQYFLLIFLFLAKIINSPRTVLMIQISHLAYRSEDMYIAWKFQLKVTF